jgi:DNA-binding response OmpR family regulator
VYLTSVDDEGRGRELGAAEYLRKPIRLEELLAAVSRQLRPQP